MTDLTVLTQIPAVTTWLRDISQTVGYTAELFERHNGYEALSP